MTKIKKLFILLMLAAAFIWSVHTVNVFWKYVGIWSDMGMTGRAFISQIIFLLLKNIPTVIVIAVAKSKWS